ncbi:MAG: DUF2232 domain-containing protein [Gemmatimonadetes bacterium]|nr:DUF2232 domain-containing protein [Gemmatimonadota bacterium]
MTAPAPAAPRGRGWGLVVLALVGMLLVPEIAAIVVPVTRSMLLVLPALGALMLAGWVAGGSIWLALAWVAVSVLAVAWPPAASSFDAIERGWAVILAAFFGVAVLARLRRHEVVPSFLAPALAAVALAVVLGGGVLLLTQGGVTHAQSLVEGEYQARLEKPIAVWEQYFASKEWTDAAAGSPAVAEFGADFLTQLRALPALAMAYVRVAPAMLALESLAALALAWAVYHRLGRRPLGSPLGALRDFRFSDHLVWGLAGGLVLLVVPGVDATFVAGLNLIVFFGALYALRGLGVLAWFFKPGRAATVLLVLASLLAFPIVMPALLAAALGLGVGDTWLDWRSRPRPSPQSSE